MPSKTAKQQRYMAMCSTAKGRKKAHKKCPPMSVAKEYRHMDRKAKFRHPPGDAQYV